MSLYFLNQKKSRLTPLCIFIFLASFLSFGNTVKAAETDIDTLIASASSSPEDSEAQFRLGEALVIAERYEEALSALNKCVELNPEHPMAWCYIGSANSALENYDEAIASFKKAIELDPENASAHCALAINLISSGNKGEAAKVNEKLKTLDKALYDTISSML